MPTLSRIHPCLWFDTESEAAANYYCGIFPNSKITQITRYGEAGNEYHQRLGTVLTVAFELDGVKFAALNGGPNFKFNEAVSFMVMCDSQDEIDHYWNKLSDGGDPKAQQCGWLKDKFGVSWQIVPRVFMQMIDDHATPGSQRAMAAMMNMKKMDIAALQRAYDGK